MFDYLQKFNNLAKSLRDKVSSPEAMRTISGLEDKYKTDLAAVVMKIMTKTLTFNALVDFFINNSSLSKEEALNLKSDLLNKVFFSLKDYLGIETEKSDNTVDFAAAVIKETGISLASEDLYLRLKNIILTYLKGVRNKMDTKNSFTKAVQFGGLNLSDEDAEKIFLAIDSKSDAKTVPVQENFEPEKEIVSSTPVLEEEKDARNESSRDKLDKIIMSAEAANSSFFSIQDNKNGQKPQIGGKEPAVMLQEEKKPYLLANEQKEEVKLLEKEDYKLLKQEPVVPVNLPIEETTLLQEDREKDEAEAGEVKVEDVATEEKKVIDLNKEIEKEISNIKLEEEAKIEEKKELEPLVEDEAEKMLELSKIEDKKTIKVEEKEFVPSKTLNLNLKRPAAVPGNSSKIRINDIRPVTKIVSPIDELRLLDITNFRRLGDTPKEIVLKIFSKIKLLEKDGYDKMIAGVKAWRQSEVNHLYIKIGQEVIMKNSSFSDIISQRERAGQAHLSTEEINAISQLNSKLSF